MSRTFEDFNNNHGQNIPLWLQGDVALLYAGIMRNPDFPMTPQPGLVNRDTIISLIFPTAFSGETPRARIVHCSRDTQAALERGGVMLDAFGINGAIVREDLCHILLPTFIQNYRHDDGFFNVWMPDRNRHGRYVLRAVVDLRSRAELTAFVGNHFPTESNDPHDEL